MKQHSLGTKLLSAAILLALVAYFGLQAVQYFADPLTTTLAYTDSVEETFRLSGYVVRQERVLPEDTGGLLQLQRDEGERVSAGGLVAVAYADQASLERQQEIESLEERIEQLQYAQEAALGVEVVQKLDTQIMQNILDYRAALAAERLNEAEKHASQLRSQILKREYAGAASVDLDAQIRALQEQRDSLKPQAAGSVRRITAPEAGVYSAVVDGYETVLTPQILAELTPAQLDSARADSGVRSNVGKLILGSEWYYAASVQQETAQQLQKKEEQGYALRLRFAKGVEQELPVEIESVGPAENGRVVVVLRGDQFLSQLTLLRQQSAQVVYNTIEGIRIPKEALRVVTKTTTLEDGQEQHQQVTGVYCVVGMEARFKPVQVVYTGETFVLVRPEISSDQETLRLRAGEEVIVTAVDLYDGKIVRNYTDQ